MEAHVQIGASANLQLLHALLIYTDQQRVFATLHDIISQDEGAPMLAAAQPLSLGFLQRLAEGLGKQIAPEILPENVLARTPEMIVWWSPAARRTMFFGDADEQARKLNGLNFPHPPLVFIEIPWHSQFSQQVFKLLLLNRFPLNSRPNPVERVRILAEAMIAPSGRLHLFLQVVRQLDFEPAGQGTFPLN